MKSCSPAVEATAPRNSPPPSHTNCAHTGFVGVAPALTHSIVLTILESVAPLLARNGDTANAEVSPCAAEVTDTAVLNAPSSEEVPEALTVNLAVVAFDEPFEISVRDGGVTLVAGVAFVLADSIETSWVVDVGFTAFQDGDETDGPVTVGVFAAPEVTTRETDPSGSFVNTSGVVVMFRISIDQLLTDSDGTVEVGSRLIMLAAHFELPRTSR